MIAVIGAIAAIQVTTPALAASTAVTATAAVSAVAAVVVEHHTFVHYPTICVTVLLAINILSCCVMSLDPIAGTAVRFQCWTL